MKILPVKTAPPDALIDRRHIPRKGAYGSYRPCLRWEFGHCCAFCLTHESDLTEHGVEGTALTWIEHQLPQSHDPDGSRVNDYQNCFYACKFCNKARGTEPLVDPEGRRLLDPCSTIWADRFKRQGEELLPTTDDPDASRTHRVYDLDDPRKRAMRATRERILTDAFRALRECPPLIAQLLELAKAPGSNRTGFIQAAEKIHELMTRAKRDLMRYSVPPSDSDSSCRCADHAVCNLPLFLTEQLIEVPAVELDS